MGKYRICYEPGSVHPHKAKDSEWIKWFQAIRYKTSVGRITNIHCNGISLAYKLHENELRDGPRHQCGARVLLVQ